MILKADLLDTTWFAFTRRYESEDAAKQDFERLADAGERRLGKLDLGTYRHTNAQRMVFITVVGLKWDGVEFAHGILRGTDYRLEPDALTALCLRRARVVMRLEEGQAQAGVHRFPHGEGVPLTRAGEMADGS